MNNYIVTSDRDVIVVTNTATLVVNKTECRDKKKKKKNFNKENQITHRVRLFSQLEGISISNIVEKVWAML